MRILMLHAEYNASMPSGETISARVESDALAQRGHELLNFSLDRSPVGLTLSPRSLRERLRAFRPAILHVQNVFPWGLPALINVASTEDVPLAWSLRNTRLLCVAGSQWREGQRCELCVDARSWSPGIRHACYRGSKALSVAATAQVRGYRRALDRHTRSHLIATSRYLRDRHVAGGIDPRRISVKPNLVPMPTHEPLPLDKRRPQVVFAGRLVHEKGVDTVLNALREPAWPTELTLCVIGDGPLRNQVERAMHRSNGRLSYLGLMTHNHVLDVMASSLAVVIPSTWAEPFGRVAIEAYSRGTPVIASRIGGLRELLEDQEPDLGVRPGDSAVVANYIARVLERPDHWTRASNSSYASYLAQYTPSIVAQRTEDIYRKLVGASCA